MCHGTEIHPPPKKKKEVKKVKKVKKQVKKVSERKCVRDWDTVQA